MKAIPVLAIKGGVGKSTVCAHLGLALRDKGLKIGFLDSVPAYSALIIKRQQRASWNIEIDVLSIEALWEGCGGDTWEKDGIEYKAPREPVWVFQGATSGKYSTWARVLHLLRHNYLGDLLRINTTSGLVDVSPNHSMLSFHSKVVDAKELRIGDRIPSPSVNRVCSERGIFIGTSDLAWLYGFFLAEGSISRRGRGYLVSIGNNDSALLERAKAIIERELNLPVSSVFPDNSRTKKGFVPAYKLAVNNFRAYEFFRQNFYDLYGKKVPTAIFNAPKHIKMAFLQGFNDGDGIKRKPPPTSYDSTFQVLSQGIITLVQETSGNSFSVQIREDKPKVVSVTFNKGVRNRKGRGIIKKIVQIPYEGYLYDIETDNHTFCTGVGAIRVHNTDVTGANLPSALGMKEPFPRGGLDTRREKMKAVSIDGYEVFSIAFRFGKAALLWEGGEKKIEAFGKEYDLHGTGRYQLVRQMLQNVEFGDIDYLLVDCPPTCVTAETRILTNPSGPVELSKLKIGDSVYAYHEGKLVPRRVVDIIPRGQDAVYRVSIGHRQIETNSRHPFLRYGKWSSPYWCPLEHLKVGDRVVMANCIIEGEPKKLKGTPSFGLTIPEETTEEFMQFVGFFVGDGFIKKDRTSLRVVLCEPRGTERRLQYEELTQRLFNKCPNPKDRWIIIHNRKLAELIHELDLDYPCSEKQIPGWVFSLPLTQRMAFIKGYCDSDGYLRSRPSRGYISTRMTFHTPNLSLLKDLQDLATSCGYRTTAIWPDRRKMPPVVRGRKQNQQQAYWMECIPKMNAQHPHINNARPSTLGRIKKIEAIGYKDVYDLQVEEDHNFVANGFITHNSGDEVLSLVEHLPNIWGVILVCQPTNLSVEDIERALNMVEVKRLPVLGMVANMTYAIAPVSREEFCPFLDAGVDIERFAQQRGIPLLVSIPLTPEREIIDSKFRELADKVINARVVRIWEKSFKEKLGTGILKGSIKAFFAKEN